MARNSTYDSHAEYIAKYWSGRCKLPYLRTHNLEPVYQLEEWEYLLTVAHLINWSHGQSDQLNMVESIICTH